ncbi:hypothetical protein HF086_018196 [Spodoptera exigua]|uniref:Endonuclease/exonuclease/phosphatase domain-containing protein n=1 Tax=Spodoptera exigua TaxID=7107 RepID=A0A922MLZ2_SPOEX|nr:hypothetical protein HF086_018196 [Spodoptera exigua]
MHSDSKNTWKCPGCINKQPKLDNTNTPIRSAKPCSPTSSINNSSPTDQSNITQRRKPSQCLPTNEETTRLTDITSGSLREIIRQEINIALQDTIKGMIKEQFVNSDVLEHFIENSNSVMVRNSNSSTIILGDFNLSGIDWIHSTAGDWCSASTGSSGYLKNIFLNFISFSNLRQYNWIKNFQNKTLDLVLSDNEQIKISNCPDPIRELDKFHPAFEIALQIPVESKKIFYGDC